MARGEDEWSFYVQDASSSLNSLSLIKPLGSWTLEDLNDFFYSKKTAKESWFSFPLKLILFIYV